MEIYLAQHGKATSKEENPERPLTSEGRQETRRVAEALAGAGVTVDAVWHSGKLRARQTAEIFAAALAPPGGVAEREWLGPTDDPTAAVAAARESGRRVLLVGHLPYMSRLPGLLLTGDPEARPVEARHSAVVALGESDGGWALRWYVTPEVV